MAKPRLFLLDGSAVAYRSYFAFIKNPLTNSQGLNTSAAFGYIKTLLTLLEREKPDFFAVVNDSREPTFRHKKYKEYKATREKMPEDMAECLPYIDKLVRAMGIPLLVLPGFEADDLIGTLVTRAKKEKMQSFIVSGDKDFMQLIGPDVKMVKPIPPNDFIVLDEKEVLEKFGVRPDQVIDVLSLMGDASDNVPGVPGFGEKTATALIQEFGSLDDLIKNADKIARPRTKELFLANIPKAELSRELVTIHCEVPIPQKAADLVCVKPDLVKMKELLAELEFKNLMDRVEAYAGGFGAVKKAVGAKAKPPAGKTAAEREGTSAPAAVPAVSDKYHTLSGLAEVEKALAKASRASEVAVDTETTGLDPLTAEIVGVSLSWEAGEAVYIPFNLSMKKEELVRVLKPFLEDARIKKGGQNSKYDWAVFKTHGIEPRGFAFDTMVESYLLDSSGRQHNLDALALKHFKYVKIPTEALIGSGKKQVSMADVPVETVSQYSCEDADFTLRIHQLLGPRVKAEGLSRLYEEVELPLVMVLEDMERKGVSVDTDLLKGLSEEAGKELVKLTKRIYKEAGEEFNIGSPQQLGKVLFDKMQVQKISGTRVKKTKTGYATDVDVLESLKGIPVADLILDYRQVAKLKNTYLDVLPTLVSPLDGRIHTSYNQAVAATGRLSSTDPNLQNIPTRSDFGRRIRGAFVPRDAKHAMISADYSQIELRVLAHLTEDPNLIAAFEKDEDVHARTASLIFGVPLDKVSSAQRNQAKTINFGVLYGMGPQRLARENGVTMAEAKKFIEEYFAKYPGIKEFTTEQVELARTQGFVTTILGRKRLLPEMKSANIGLRLNAERMAVNTPVQGSAADLIKVAMVRIHSQLLHKKMKTVMIMQVHDELVFEAPKDEVAAAEKLIVHEMENAIKLKVPLKVDVGTGKSWLEAH